MSPFEIGKTEFFSKYPIYPIWKTNTQVQKQPYTCPICGGNGLVQNGFYDQVGGQWSSTSCSPEQCRSCKGKGVIWG